MGLVKGDRLGPYEILAPVGAGGMGEVYKARDTRLKREVAVKVLSERLGGDASALARFEREAMAVAALSHPNILAIHDFGHEGDVTYAVMELLEGETLRERLNRGALSASKATDIAAQIAKGMAAAHEKGIVHRDLKPANVFLTKDGQVKILDFGLAKVAPPPAAVDGGVSQEVTADVSTRSGAVMGTVGYMAPEQVRGQTADARSDLFAFGVLLYEMLAGKRAFAGDTPSDTLAAILTRDPDPLPQVTPPGLERVVKRCLEKRPEDRFFTAHDLLLALEIASSSSVPPTSKNSLALPGFLRESKSRWIVTAGALAAILAALAGVWWYRQSARERWVRREALPELEGIVDRLQAGGEGREGWDAFVLARKIDAVAPGDPLVELLRPKFTTEISITSDPPGATVCMRYYDEPDAVPILLGKTPLKRVPYPQACTRLQLTLAGQAPLEDVYDWGWFDEVVYRFPPPGEVPDGMSLVAGGPFPMILPSLQQLGTEATNLYAMDRHEVTNRDYKRFVEAGGYTDPKYWRQAFLDGGGQISWKEAMARFTDRTGRPGPATWEVGSYPQGREGYPVSGVSWYEAAAYAQWAGKSLPTVFHWNQIAFTPASPRIVPLANLNGSGPVAVGSTKSANRFGVYDLAGNVREWVLNASDGGRERFILGGGWDDPEYAFEDAFAQPAFDRSPTNGFRCIRYLGEEPNLAALERPVQRQVRDFETEKPVTDSVFAQYLRQFAYDKKPLDARVEEEERTAAGLRQKITFNAAYGNERNAAYLFLPPEGKPPFQVVIFFPGSFVIHVRSSKSLELGMNADFLPKSGRAVLFPVYKGTFERGDDLTSDIPSDTAAWRDHVLMWGKDLARSIDYLETRKDLDSGRIAYYGFSWGGQMGSILPAVERRMRANVLYVAGIPCQRPFPEVDSLNYVPRVKQPTLILDGDLDYIFPKETSQRPLFELLGTPAADKKWLVYPGGHDVPRMELIKESLAWLDKYLGPVRQ